MVFEIFVFQSAGLCSEMSTAMQWMGKCQNLAYTWQVNMDPLRRHQVCLLYSSGHDRLAEEVDSSILMYRFLGGSAHIIGTLSTYYLY